MAKTWIDEELKKDWWKRDSAKYMKLILDIYRMKMSHWDRRNAAKQRRLDRLEAERRALDKDGNLWGIGISNFGLTEAIKKDDLAGIRSWLRQTELDLHYYYTVYGFGHESRPGDRKRSSRNGKRRATEAHGGEVMATQRPEAKKGLVSLRDIALPLIERGIRVVPARPGERMSTLPAWPILATTDPERIAEWDRQYPDWNLVCVANFEDNLIVDIDDLKAAYKIGLPKVPTTFTVQSPKGYHVYFLHTDRSRAVGQRVVQGVAELKANNLSCCAPGCTRADGKKYVVCDESQLVPVPDNYLDWFEVNDPRQKMSGCQPVDDDFDFEEFCDFYGIEVRGDGPKYYPSFCPVKGDIHHTDKGGPDLGACMIYFDGETLGWKDLAANCDGASMTIGGLIKFLNDQKGESYPDVIWPDEPIPTEGLPGFELEEPTDPPPPPPPVNIEEREPAAFETLFPNSPWQNY